ILKKLKTELLYDPAIALGDINPKDRKMLIQRGTWIPMFIAGLSTIAKSWKEPKCPAIDEWRKMWYIYTMKLLVVLSRIGINFQYISFKKKGMKIRGACLAQ
ncbi:LORF2 protein, partial [Crocuta crocuta]